MSGRIKHTKNELKAQRDALKRFTRFLPTLQLKKQQLQIEVRNLDAKIREKQKEEDRLRESVQAWVSMFAEGDAGVAEELRVSEVRTSVGNIAGVSIPVLERVAFETAVPDLLASPSWVDDGRRVLEQLARLGIEREVLNRQHALLNDELRRTTQRVNLFEKVKIPEARDTIRVIRIFLGDEQTAEVARAKIAKGKATVREGAA